MLIAPGDGHLRTAIVLVPPVRKRYGSLTVRFNWQLGDVVVQYIVIEAIAHRFAPWTLTAGHSMMKNRQKRPHFTVPSFE